MSPIDPQAAAQACKQIEQRLAEYPVEVLREAKRRMEIEAHNAPVDAKKAEKSANKAKMKRHLKRASKEKLGKPYAGKARVTFVHPSQEFDLRG